MFHSIKIGTDLSAVENWVDTWADWGLIPSAKPVVSMAGANIKWQEIPGRDEPIDTTEIVSNKVTYKNRTGSWSFIFVDDNMTLIPGATFDLHLATSNNTEDSTPWNRKFADTVLYRAIEVRYRQIANYLHGKRYKCLLEDEPDFYYEGRFQVGNLGSNKNYSTLTINYDLLPKKKHFLSNTTWGPSGPFDHILLEGDTLPVTGSSVGETWQELKKNNQQTSL